MDKAKRNEVRRINWTRRKTVKQHITQTQSAAVKKKPPPWGEKAKRNEVQR